MSSQSDRRLSIDELKALNAKDLSTASEGERHITLTDRNWMAVLNILGRLCSLETNTQEALALLLTRPDVEELLNRIDRSTQTQLRSLRSDAESFGQQAGSLSERFSSDAERLVSHTETSLRTMENSTESTLREMVRETNSQISDLIGSARMWLVTLGVVSIAAIVLLTVLFGLIMLPKLS